MKTWGAADAPPLVYWPGLLGNADSFREVAPAFAARGWRVVSVEPDADDDQTMPRLADRLAAAAAERPFVAVGSSWGATVALWAAVRHPDRCRAAVLLDGGLGAPLDRGPLEEAEAAIRTQYDDLSWPSLDAYVEVMRAQARRWSPELEAIERSWPRQVDGRWVPPHPPEVAVARYRGWAPYPAAETYATLRETRIPVLLLFATEPADARRDLEPRLDRFVREVTHADVRRLDGVSHNVLDDVGPPLADVVCDWLDSKLTA